MSETVPLYFLIAGEPSGDVIGAHLMRALRAQTGGNIRFAGIGGEQMAAEGLDSLVPIRELAIMGIMEVLPSALRVLRRVRETVATILRLKPLAVVTIDSSGFCFRVGERIKPLKDRPVLIHYVAPMVWAWRAHRVKYALGAADYLLTLFPFEPPYFEAVGLPSAYVGHPIIESGADSGDAAGFRARHGLDATQPVLAVLPGSRRGEVRRLLPVFMETVERLRRHFPNLAVAIPTVETVADAVAEMVAGMPGKVIVLRGVREKYDCFAAATAALAASGTVTLECALARLPTIVAYRMFPPTAWFVRRNAKTRYAGLINILLGREAMPEFLQEECVPETLEAAISPLIADPSARQAQIDAAAEALAMIGEGGVPPSHRAAHLVLEWSGYARSASET